MSYLLRRKINVKITVNFSQELYEKNTIELPFWQAVLLCYDEIADEIFKLREQREKCTVDTAARDAQIARINELQDFIITGPAADAGRAAAQASTPSKAALAASCFGFSFILSYLLGVESAGA